MTCRIGAAAVAAVVALAAGCSNKVAQDVAAKNDANIKRVANLYTAHMAQRGWAGPKSEDEFKEFIRKDMPAENLQMMKVDPANVDAIFVSDRDGKPFKIRYGVGGGPGASIPVVFEQDGQGGRKMVGYTFGKFEEVDDAQAKQLWDGKAAPTTAAQGGPGQPGGRP